MSFEEVGIRLRTDGVVESTNGISLAGKAIDALGKAASTAAPELAGAVGEVDGLASAAARGASALGPVGLALGGVATAAAGLAFVASKGAQENLAFERAIILSGNAAGTTAGQLAQMAAESGKVVGSTAAAADVLARLVETGNVSAESLQSSAQAALSLQRSLGVEVSKTVAAFNAMGEDPLKAVVKLNEQYHFLSINTYEQVRALAKQGDAFAAANLAQQAYAKAALERSAAMDKNLGVLERGWRSVGDAASRAWNLMLGVGRKDSLEQQLQAVETALAAPIRRGGNTLDAQARRDSLRAQRDVLKQQLAELADEAKMQAQMARVVEEKAQADAKEKDPKAVREKAYKQRGFMGPTFEDMFGPPANVKEVLKGRDANREARVAELESYDKIDRALAKDRMAAEEADRRERLKREQALAEEMAAAWANYIELVKPVWQQMVESWGDATQQMREAYNNSVGSALVEGENQFRRWATTGKFSIRSVFQAFAAEQASGAFRSLFGQLFGGMLGGPSFYMRGATGFGDYNMAAQLSGERAYGGPVQAGKAYLVGEKGPEILRMGSQGGTVIPNDKISGGRSIVFSPVINIDSRTDRAEVGALVQAAMQQSQAELLQRMERGEV